MPALVTALDDADWQTAHFANMGLEAISGEALDAPRSTLEWKRWWEEIGSVEKLTERVVRREVVPNRISERDAWLEAVVRLAWRGDVASVRAAAGPRVLEWVRSTPPGPEVVRAAGWLKLAEALPSITPWLVGGANPRAEEPVPDADDALEREVRGMALAREAALACGRIGTPEAIDTLWNTLAKTVPVRNPAPSRHYQTGPRPEEYTYLRALLVAGARPTLAHVPQLVALLPSTFGEKPRFEDRTKPLASQRAVLARRLLERTDLLDKTLAVARSVLRGEADTHDPLYAALLQGSNNDRPYSEHGHPFEVLKQIEPEQALQYLACLAVSPQDAPESLVAPFLASKHHRERIEAAVVLRRVGWSQPATAKLLVDQIREPYPFREIWSIGKGRFELNFRDKAYLLIALAAHMPDVAALREFADSSKYFRDVRLGLGLGLGLRSAADPATIELLALLERDPIFSVRRTARNSLGLLADTEMFAGRNEPTVSPVAPYVQAKPVIPAWTFADARPDAAPPVAAIEAGEDAFVRALVASVDAKGYANVANTFARNAERMRLFDARRLEELVIERARSARELTDAERAASAPRSRRRIPSRTTWRRGSPSSGRMRPSRGRCCPAWGRGSTRPTRWVCIGGRAAECAEWRGGGGSRDSRGDRRAEILRQGLRVPRHGVRVRRGAGVGSARRHGRSPDIDAALATSENAWLRAGYLEGLALSNHPRVRELLERTLAEAPGAFLEEEARFGLSLSR